MYFNNISKTELCEQLKLLLGKAHTQELSPLTGANNSKENGIIKNPTMERTVPML